MTAIWESGLIMVGTRLCSKHWKRVVLLFVSFLFHAATVFKLFSAVVDVGGYIMAFFFFRYLLLTSQNRFTLAFPSLLGWPVKAE